VASEEGWKLGSGLELVASEEGWKLGNGFRYTTH
jgi:hypothetical protein